MDSTLNMINRLIPISDFNKGYASKIFDRLDNDKKLIVLKNNRPSAVLLSTDEYERLAEIENEYMLIMEANRRLERAANAVSYEDALNRMGISESELKVAEDVEI